MAIIPAATGAGGIRSDLTTVPLEDVDPGHVVVATRAADRGRLVAGFRKYAREQLTEPVSPQ